MGNSLLLSVKSHHLAQSGLPLSDRKAHFVLQLHGYQSPAAGTGQDV